MNTSLPAVLLRFRLQRGLLFGVLIVAALLAFEIFNFSTTEFALTDLLGDLDFAGVRWATILSIAFCGIDFAGIARLFTPEQGADEPNEVWYLFGAWLLAAAMNAMLTWWGVSIAILNHQTLGNAVIGQDVLLKVVPIFVAVLVWLIRVMIIGTFSVAGERLFSQAEQGVQRRSFRNQTNNVPALAAQNTRNFAPARTNSQNVANFRSAPKNRSQNEPEFPAEAPAYNRPEPTYHPISMSARPRNGGNNSGGSIRS